VKRLIVIALAAMAATAGPAQAKTCDEPKFPGSGYFTSLSVKKTTCATGKKVALAFNACRREHGLKGRCTHKVKKYACTEQRQSIPTEIDAFVTCKKGKRQVKFSYQQNL
jgi:hypothetical protein